MEDMLGLMIGIGLSATCGFRVFVPLLGISLAAQSGELTLAEGFEWLASPEATAAFGFATLLEVGGYYVPWIDNMLDTAATPAAVVAGTIVTASMVGDMSPLLQWSLAIIAGGGSAGIIQGGSVLIRTASAATTGGLGNPVVSTGELIISVIGTVLAIMVPVLMVAIVVVLLQWMIRRLVRFFNKKEEIKQLPQA